ncbi:MAG: 30S ribosomal protein THX [Flavobacteriaceae bacterium]|nr:30S ribosomal protein THX [Flavobacteriaceae bacterium]
MGKGDKKTRRGKIVNKAFGVSRSRKKIKARKKATTH